MDFSMRSQKHTIDYILTCNTMKHAVIDACTTSQPDISDHRLVRCKFKLANFIKRKKGITTPKFNVGRLKSPATATEFAECVDDHLEDCDERQCLMNKIQTGLITASTNILGKNRTPRDNN